jgi:nucleoside-diphosphate-sugar epimerase
MKFLITGGSGFLGINLIRFLLEKDHEITSLDLEEFDYEDCKEKIISIVGDIRDKKTVKAVMEGQDYVIHCAAALPLYSEEEIFSTDVEGSRIIFDQALNAGVKRCIHISSTAVYGVPDHHPLYETDELIGVGHYGEAKVQAEQVAMDYREKGLLLTVIRPKSFVGPERLGAFAMLYDWAKDGKGFPVIGNGKNRYQLLDVYDLCQAIYLAIEGDEDKVNEAFNIGAKQFTTLKEDFQAVLDKAGFNKKVRAFPASPVIFSLRILEFFKLSPLYKWIYETAGKDSFVSIEKAEEQLDFKPIYSNKDALIRNYEWYMENLEKFDKKSGVSHRVPWSQGVLKIAKWFF